MIDILEAQDTSAQADTRRVGTDKWFRARENKCMRGRAADEAKEAGQQMTLGRRLRDDQCS